MLLDYFKEEKQAYLKEAEEVQPEVVEVVTQPKSYLFVRVEEIFQYLFQKNMIINCEIAQIAEDAFNINGREVKMYIQFEQVKVFENNNSVLFEDWLSNNYPKVTQTIPKKKSVDNSQRQSQGQNRSNSAIRSGIQTKLSVKK